MKLTAKQYLEQLRVLDTKINQKLRELDNLIAVATNTGAIDYSKDKVQTSSQNAQEEKICKYVDLDAEINREIDIYVNERHKIINQIHELKNVDYITLLYKRYVEYKSLEQICVEMHFSYVYVRKMHGYALKNFEDKFLKDDTQ